MKNILVALVAMGFLWSCSTPAKEASANQQAEEIPASEVQASDNTINLLNPNTASQEELAAVEGIGDSAASILIASRPYLDMMSFHNQLVATLGEVDKNQMYNRVFVPINLNTAAEEEFKLVPGVGDKMAHEFEEYRPYTKVEQFRREIGKYVDETEVARYENFVFVPFDLNTATDEEFLSIPGVGDKMLHEFKEYRPYTSMEQFRREIGKYVSEEQVALYERYVQIIK